VSEKDKVEKVASFVGGGFLGRKFLGLRVFKTFKLFVFIYYIFRSLAPETVHKFCLIFVTVDLQKRLI